MPMTCFIWGKGGGGGPYERKDFITVIAYGWKGGEEEAAGRQQTIPLLLPSGGEEGGEKSRRFRGKKLTNVGARGGFIPLWFMSWFPRGKKEKGGGPGPCGGRRTSF